MEGLYGLDRVSMTSVIRHIIIIEFYSHRPDSLTVILLFTNSIISLVIMKCKFDVFHIISEDIFLD